jgi:hypothetical protein
VFKFDRHFFITRIKDVQKFIPRLAYRHPPVLLQSPAYARNGHLRKQSAPRQNSLEMIASVISNFRCFKHLDTCLSRILLSGSAGSTTEACFWLCALAWVDYPPTSTSSWTKIHGPFFEELTPDKSSWAKTSYYIMDLEKLVIDNIKRIRKEHASN